MLYNYFNSGIPYPSLHFGFSQTQPTHLNTMDASTDRGNVDQQTQMQNSEGHAHDDSLKAFPVNDFDMTEADMPGAMDDSVESALQHAMNEYHQSSEVSEDKQQDSTTENMQIEDQFPSASFGEVPISNSAISFSEHEDRVTTNTDRAAFDPDPFQTSMFEDGFLDQTSIRDTQVHPEEETTLPNSADHLYLPESASQDASGDHSAHTAPVADLPTHLDPVGVTDVITNFDISTYQPGSIPPFKGRSRSASLPPSKPNSRYSAMANWPPPKPEFANRVDIYPPENAPLHVWIQAYALRWGVWLAEIKDETIREKVLAVVTEKMKAAWETAIREGYYLKPEPGDATSDQEKGEGDAQTKRGRKRAQSQSKLPAGFASEGKDKFAITNGELVQHGITFDTIIQRVTSQDFDAGELRYDEVLSNMNPDVIGMKHWSASAWGSTVNRNLLMYCFWVVQEERQHWARLNVLLKKFNKDHQKRNTKARMDGVREREYQHMALATELTLREQEAAGIRDQQEDAADNNESTPVDLISEAEDNAQQDVQSPEQSNAEPQLSKIQITELAQAILVAPNEDALMQAFVSHGVQAGDPVLGGVVTATEDEEEVKKTLVEILVNVSRSMHLVRNSRTQQPSELLKINYDVRFMQKHVGFLRQKLYHILSNLSKLPALPQSNIQGHNTVINQKLPQPHTTRPQAGEFAPQIEDVPKSEISDEDGDLKLTEGDLSTVNNRKIDQMLPAQAADGESLVEAPARRDPTEQRAELKRLYTTEQWIPILNGMLAQRKLPLVSGVLDNWNPVKDILQNQLGFNSHDRNTILQNFKAGFKSFCLEKGVPPLDSSSKSPDPSTRSAESPVPSQAPHNSSTTANWPSDAEILSAIPSQGIEAAELMQLFRARVSSDNPRFIEALKRLSLFDQTTYKVYPKQQTLPPLSRQYNMLPPSSMPTSQTTANAVSSIATPNKVVRLKVPSQGNTKFGNPLPRQDESSFPPEYRSKEVNTSRSFSFRYLPHATLEQRQRMDEGIEEYIANTIKRRQKGRWGQYVSFKDPQDSESPTIAHGFWDLNNKGERATGIEWFYAGQDMPAGWDTEGPDSQSQVSDQSQSQQSMSISSEQAQPRLKLKVSKPSAASDATKLRFPTPGSQTGMPPQQNFNTMNPQQQYGNFNSMPPSFNYNNYPGQSPQQSGTRFQQDFSNSHPATINPALLMAKPDQSNAYHTQQTGTTSAYCQQAQDQDNDKRGTKRPAPTQKAGRNKKKVRKTIVPDDDDDDEDYDPTQEY